jgi:hypothetical protein
LINESDIRTNNIIKAFFSNIIFLFLALPLPCLPCFAAEKPHIWPATRHDNRKTNLSDLVGPNNLNLIWSMDIQGAVTGIVVDRNGNIIGSSHRFNMAASGRESISFLFSVTPSGEKSWEFELDGVPGPPVLDSKGNIYISCGGSILYSISPGGELN